MTGSLSAFKHDDFAEVGFRIGPFPQVPWRPLQRDEEIIGFGSGANSQGWPEPVFWGRFWTPEGLVWMLEVRLYGDDFHASLLTLKGECWGQRSIQKLLYELGGGDWNLDLQLAAVDVEQKFAVMRRDDNNNEFEVSRHGSKVVADSEVAIWSSGGHKQDYWVEVR